VSFTFCIESFGSNLPMPWHSTFQSNAPTYQVVRYILMNGLAIPCKAAPQSPVLSDLEVSSPQKEWSYDIKKL